MSDTKNTRRIFGRSPLLFAGAGLLLVVVVGFFWITGSRLGSLQRQLSGAEEAAENVNKRMREYSRELDLAIQRAQTAREQAVEAEQKAAVAEQKAEMSTAARVEAEWQAERLRAEAEAAAALSAEAREQLEAMRRKREEELNRMQDALNRIAPTHRTPLGMVMELTDDSFKFDFDKAALRPENREILSRVAGVLLASEGYRLFVYGHTDDVGTDEYNQGLSERRADSVADYLIKAGVPPEIISKKGFGKSSPRIKQATRDAREKNRRVEIGIVDTIVSYHGTVPK